MEIIKYYLSKFLQILYSITISMIKPKYFQLNPSKSNATSKASLHNLINEVERIRIAKENMISFASGEGKFKQKIDNLQYELQSCITNINIEAKRHKILNELIALLKGQMFKYQSTKKKQEEEEEVKRDKQMAKYQYQIDQILQKHNEQIAKIHNLKELANSRRSERVVYSNLFKKLEREIKHYQQIYKQQLMISEYTGVKTSKLTSTQQRVSSPNKDLIEVDQKRKIAQELVKKNYERRYTFTDSKNVTPVSETSWNGFVTESKQQNGFKSSKGVHNTKKIYLMGEDNEKSELRGTGSKEDKFGHTKDLLKQISQYTNLIDKIKVHAQCNNVEELLEHYSQLQQQNATLTQKIRGCDETIDRIVEKGERIHKKMTEEEVARKLTIIPTLPHGHSQTFHLENSNVTETEQEQLAKLKNQMIQIGQLFGVQNESQSKDSFNDQFFQILDKKITVLYQQISNNRFQFNKTQDTLLSETIVDCLLEKMDKFHSCERILDQSLFRQEYYKELSKRRPYKSKKDTSK